MSDFETYKGQRYRRIGLQSHECRDGRLTTLQLWESHCAVCGAPFIFKRPGGAKRFMPNRRCDKHKAPGRKVKQ